MRAVDRLTYPRSLHPGAWWLWAVALAAAASRTQNPVPLALILAVTGFVVSARRSSAPWARSYVAVLKLSLVIIVVRILFQALLTTPPSFSPLPSGIGSDGSVYSTVGPWAPVDSRAWNRIRTTMITSDSLRNAT